MRKIPWVVTFLLTDSPISCQGELHLKLMYAPAKSLTLCFVIFFGVVASAQDLNFSGVSSWITLDAPTGHEHLATDAIQEQFDGWSRDRTGNLTKTIGDGRPHRVVACGLDSFSYAVSQITDDGYLRLHRIGSGSRHPLWDQAHAGQQLRILTRSGPLVGVTAIANGHFAAQHREETAIITQNDLWLDVGAASASEVAEMGIQLLDPVLRHIPAWSYANELAGPRAGARVGCAAVMAAAEAGVNGAGSTSYVLSTQQVFGWVGLGAALRWLPALNELVIVAPGESAHRNEEVTEVGTRLDSRLTSRNIASIRIISPRVADAGALMERIDYAAAEELLATLVNTIDPSASIPAWLPAPGQAGVLNAESSRWGQSQNASRLQEIEQWLDQLAERSAVPGHEGPIRSFVYNGLPQWARDTAQTDDMGNMWVEFGPVGETTVFVAHMDEVGYQIASIDPDGTVNLDRLGGVVTPAWEGQPSLLQLDSGYGPLSAAESPQLRGVFLSRDNPIQKQPEQVRAWYGLNAEQLASMGVEPGMGVTGYKEGHRMGAYRYSSRSLDDRVGTTALLLAIQNIDPATLDHRVVFAWSVREEGGLRGASELASRMGMRTRRVYSIDTFVSSDTPLESPHFAYAPLGSGPVLRSIENAGMAIPYELDRNRAIAADANIAVQIGLTQGSTDGTGFTFYGAPNAGLSWPGRYSHSPAEIADLRDVEGLIRLIQAMAEAPLDVN